MFNAILIAIRFIILVFNGQKHVALENAALRQQLAVFKREAKRPKLQGRDRLFSIVLRMIWQDWKSTTSHFGHPQVGSNNGRRKPSVGSATDPRRVAKARI